MSVRMARPDDAAAMLAIYRPIVRETTISFELEPPSVEAFAARIASTIERYPWVVWEEEGVRGYAYAGSHRDRPAYAWSVESSVYVAAAHRRQGIAGALYDELFERLREQGFFNVFAGITLPNDRSISFHRSRRFAPVGVYRQVGYKFGTWHDVAWFGLRLRPEEEHPHDRPRPPSPV